MTAGQVFRALFIHIFCGEIVTRWKKLLKEGIHSGKMRRKNRMHCADINTTKERRSKE